MILTGVTVAAAIAVPLALALSRDHGANYERVEKASSLDIAWGSDPRTYPVPALPDGYSTSNYDGVGAYYGTSFVKGVTEIGDTTKTITFFYKANVGTGLWDLLVTYHLNVVKGNAAPLVEPTHKSNLALNSPLPSVDFVQWLKDHPEYNGYTARNNSPTLTDATGKTVNPSDFSTLPAGTVVTATYTAYLDLVHYNDNNQATGTYTAEYAIQPANAQNATEPGDAAKQTSPKSFEYGKYAEATPPDAPATVIGNGYELSSTKIRFTAKSTIADANSPELTAVFDWTKVNTYNSGTKYEVKYDFAPKTGYIGNAYSVSQIYVIDKQKVAIPAAITNAAAQFAYGTGVAKISAPAASDATKFALKTTKYYQTVNAVDVERTAAEIDALNKDDTFKAVWTFGLTGANYVPAQGTVDTYTVTTPYTVTAGTATYTSTVTTYTPLSVPKGTTPTNVVPTDTPDATGNKGYTYDKITYNITSVPTGSNTQTGPINDLSSINTYDADTVITATITFKPDGNHTGPDKTFTKTITVVKATATQPTDKTLTGTTYEYGKPQTQPAAPTLGTGYQGSYDSTKSKIKTVVTGSTLTANGPIDWSAANTYPAGTVLEVAYTYTPATGYSGNDFSTTQDFTVVKQKVDIPTDINNTSASYGKGDDPANLTAPTPASATIFSLRGTVKYFDAGGADLTADAVKNLAENATFKAQWTFGLTDTKNYEPKTGTKDTYTITNAYTVSKSTVSYTGKKTTYDPVDVGYKGTKPADFDPTALPEPTDGYVRKTTTGSTKYEVTTPSDDGVTTTSTTVNNLDDLSNYHAGTQITVTYTFGPDANHIGNDVTVTKVLKITGTAAEKPTDAEKNAVSTKTYEYSDEQTKPTAPMLGKGYVGSFTSAKITNAVTGSKQTNNEDVSWPETDTYPAGTKFEVTFTYKVDDSHTGSEFTAVIGYTVVKKKVSIPINKVRQGTTNHDYNTTPSLTAPTADNTTLFSQRGAVKYLDANDREISAATVKGLPENATFKAQWTFGLTDTKNYEQSTGATDTYTVTNTYKVVKPTVSYTGKKTYDPVEIAYQGSKPANFDPTALPETATGFERKTTAGSTTYAVTTASDDGVTTTSTTVNNLDDVNTYHAGTEVTVTYTFGPDADHAGTNVMVTKVLKITGTAAVKPTDAQKNAATTAKTYEYTDEQTAPTAPMLGTNYVGSLTSTKITNVVTGSTLTLNGPVTWADTDTYPTGTKFEVTFTYKPDASHTGDSFTAVIGYTVVKKKVDIPTDKENTTATDFTQGTTPSFTDPTPDNALFSLSGTVKYLDSTGRTLTADGVKALTANATFKAQWTFSLTDTNNYERKTGTKDTYTVTNNYTVKSAEVSYTGKKTTYDDVSAAFKKGAPSTFSTPPTALPEPTAGYELKPGVKYAITKESTDGNTKTTNTLANLDDVDKYGAGTEITATYTFKPDASHTGDEVTVTKVLKITAVPAKQPNPSDLPVNIAQTSVSYGTTADNGPNKALPTEESAKYEYPSTTNVEGYDKGTPAKPVVTVQGPLNTPGIDNKNSPRVGATIEWDQLKNINAGTKFRVTLTYSPLASYTGSTFIKDRIYTIERQETNVQGGVDDFHYGDYRRRSGRDLFAEVQNNQLAGHTYNRNQLIVDSTRSNLINEIGSPSSISEIEKQRTGSEFSVALFLYVSPNYTDTGGGRPLRAYTARFTIVD